MSELYHHGIKGQHWGQRNGPPYPLDYNDHSSEEKKFGIRTGSSEPVSIKTETDKNRKPKPNETAIEYSKYIGKKIGRNKETGIIEYERVDRPSNKYIRSTRNELTKIFVNDLQEEDNKRSLKDGKKFVYDILYAGNKVRQMTDDKDAQNSLPLKRKELTKIQDAKKVNPGYNSERTSVANNCCLCTMAYDLRRRGYDVMARQYAPMNFLYDSSEYDFLWLYPGSKMRSPRNLDSALNMLSKEPENSRGGFFVTWGQDPHGPGHVVSYEIENGKPIMYDAQDGTRYENPKEIFDDVSNIKIIRLDNVEPNYNLIRVAVE